MWAKAQVDSMSYYEKQHEKAKLAVLAVCMLLAAAK